MEATPVGRFVSLEGPDGVGKSRAARSIVDHLRARGVAVTATREPGGTRLGDQIREIVLERGRVSRAAETDALLFNAARSQLVREVIRPALDRGDVVICDRFAGSTLAYQGYGAGVDLAALRLMEALAVNGTRPNLVLLLDAPVEVGLTRRERGDPSQLTRFEDQSRDDPAFHQRVRNGYRALAHADSQRWRIVDADRPAEAIDEELFAILDRFLSFSEPSGALTRMER